MDIDVILDPRRIPQALTGGPIGVASAARMVEAIEARLGTAGRIGRLRVFCHVPFLSPAQLARLRGRFEPGGHIEIAQRVPLSLSQEQTAAAGFQGGIGGFGGGASSGINPQQLSAILGVPVRLI